MYNNYIQTDFCVKGFGQVFLGAGDKKRARKNSTLLPVMRPTRGASRAYFFTIFFFTAFFATFFAGFFATRLTARFFGAGLIGTYTWARISSPG